MAPNPIGVCEVNAARSHSTWEVSCGRVARCQQPWSNLSQQSFDRRARPNHNRKVLDEASIIKPEEVEAFGGHSRRLWYATVAAESMHATAFPIIAFVTTVGTYLVWYFGGRGVMEEWLTFGTLIAFLGYIRMFFMPLQMLTRFSDFANRAFTAAQRLFEIIRQLCGEGVTVVYVSHFLKEVLALADDVTVLKDGHVVLTSPAVEQTPESLVTAMIGHALERTTSTKRAKL